jgi:hypothetical protein
MIQTPTLEEKPPASCCHTLVHYRRSLWLFGGGVVGKMNSGLHEFDLDRHGWREVELRNPARHPGGRFNHSAVVFGDCMIVFGGCSNNEAPIDNLAPQPTPPQPLPSTPVLTSPSSAPSSSSAAADEDDVITMTPPTTPLTVALTAPQGVDVETASSGGVVEDTSSHSQLGEPLPWDLASPLDHRTGLPLVGSPRPISASSLLPSPTLPPSFTSFLAHSDVLSTSTSTASLLGRRERKLEDCPLVVYHFESRTWSELIVRPGTTELPNRRGHSAVLYEGCMYVLMGWVQNVGLSNDFWVLDLTNPREFPTWQSIMPQPTTAATSTTTGPQAVATSSSSSSTSPVQLSRFGQPPLPLFGHSACAYEDKMLVFGGLCGDNVYSNRLYQYHFKAKYWTELECLAAPPPVLPASWPAAPGSGTTPVRRSQNPFLPEQSNYAAVSGAIPPLPFNAPAALPSGSGADSTLTPSSLLRYPRPIRTPLPAPRYSCVMWTDATGAYIHGGDSHQCSYYYDDLWRYDFQSKQWQELTWTCEGFRPCKRSGHAVVTVDGVAYMFGGELPTGTGTAREATTIDYSRNLFSLTFANPVQASLVTLCARWLLEADFRYEEEIWWDAKSSTKQVCPADFLADSLTPSTLWELQKAAGGPDGRKRGRTPAKEPDVLSIRRHGL